jgi:hypothetical protein
MKRTKEPKIIWKRKGLGKGGEGGREGGREGGVSTVGMEKMIERGWT